MGFRVSGFGLRVERRVQDGADEAVGRHHLVSAEVLKNTFGTDRHSSHFEINSEAGSYLRLIDFCITQLCA